MRSVRESTHRKFEQVRCKPNGGLGVLVIRQFEPVSGVALKNLMGHRSSEALSYYSPRAMP